MATTLSPKGFFNHTTEFEIRHWTALDVPENVAFSDLFDPAFWRHHAPKFQPGHLIRMRRVDGAWDVQLNVVAQAPGGLVVEAWPKWPDEDELAAAEAEKSKPISQTKINGQLVPRVEHTPATKWRVIGLDGNEISRGHTTKGKAEAALETYVASLGKTMAA